MNAAQAKRATRRVSKGTMTMARLWAIVPAMAVLVVACPEPRQGEPQIPVSRGWEDRAARKGGLDKPGPPRPPKKPTAARVHPMKKGEELGGPNATGRPGDWILENDEVVFVIDGLGGGAGFAQSGGNVIDAADARTRKDELGQLFTYFGTFPRQGVYGAIDAREDPDGSAVVVARGKELYDPALEVTTEYRLAAGDRALLLRTTLKNTGAAPVKLGLGDAIQWGGTEKFAPGKAVGFTGPSKGPFLGGIGRFTSYAITSTDGEIGAINGSVWSDTEQGKDVAIAPGASVAYERVFVVGERGDAASVIAELTRAAGGDVGGLEIALVDAAGKPVKAARGAKVLLATPEGQDVMSLVAARDGAKDGDAFGGEVPEGRWMVSFAPSAGRRGDGKKVAAVVKKGVAAARVTLAVTEASALTASCAAKNGGRRPPCKITVEGLAGAPNPDFGPAHVAQAAKNQIFAADAIPTVAIAPGKYRLTATRGPEYTAATSEVEIAPGKAESAELTVERVVDTTGYLATDFHQHSVLSADAPVATADRVRSNVVEGVEIAVATEHNFVADFAPLVAELDLRPFVVAIGGDEITTDADKDAWGHANVFPLASQPDKPRAGALAFLGRTPREIFDEVRAMPGAHVVQVNHPRSGKNGYFDQTGFDPKTGVGTRAGYDAAFDAVEVWNGRNLEHRAKVLDDFLALLRTLHPVTAIGDTDTHGIVGQEAGYPRTYVRVAKDDALETWDAARTDDLVLGVKQRRDVVLTNGPFVRVAANGAPIGGVARAKAGLVEVKVRVEASPFIDVKRAELRLAGAGTVVGPRVVELAPKPGAAGALTAEATFQIRVARDDAFVVVVSGDKPLRPMLVGDDKEIAPWAMTGAIWIDADGDGKALGR